MAGNSTRVRPSARQWQKESGVRALGIAGDFYLLKKPGGEIVALRATQLTWLALAAIFNYRDAVLRALWPNGAEGWDRWQAATAIMRACAARGVIDPRRHGLECEMIEPGRYRLAPCRPPLRRKWSD